MAVGIMLMASCSSLRHTASTAPVDVRVTSLTAVDLNVNPEKATRTTSWSYNPFRSVSIAQVKENTEAELLQEVDADVLVEPQYIVKKRGFLRGGSVTVIGFPAKYSNFHKLTTEESEILKNVTVTKKEKKHTHFLFF